MGFMPSKSSEINLRRVLTHLQLPSATQTRRVLVALDIEKAFALYYVFHWEKKKKNVVRLSTSSRMNFKQEKPQPAFIKNQIIMYLFHCKKPPKYCSDTMHSI